MSTIIILFPILPNVSKIGEVRSIWANAVSRQSGVSRSCQGPYARFISNQYDQFSSSFSMVQDKETHRKKIAWDCRKVILL